MKLYGYPPTRTIRALWMLREPDLDFEYVQVDPTKGEHRRPEFLAVDPAGKVPVLVDDDFVLTESVAIVLYLGEKHPQKGFLPADLRARAETESNPERRHQLRKSPKCLGVVVPASFLGRAVDPPVPASSFW